MILGRTGKNFGAGMSGGEAFIFDEEGDFALRLNQENMRLHSLSSMRDRYMVKRLMENHYLYTKSAKAKRILDNWQAETFAPRPSVCATGHPSHSRTLGLAASDSFCRDRPALRHTTSLSLARAFAQ